MADEPTTPATPEPTPDPTPVRDFSWLVSIGKHNRTCHISDEAKLLRHLFRFKQVLVGAMHLRVLGQLEVTLSRHSQISRTQFKQVLAIFQSILEDNVNDPEQNPIPEDTKQRLIEAMQEGAEIERYCEQEMSKLTTGTAKGNISFVQEFTKPGMAFKNSRY